MRRQDDNGIKAKILFALMLPEGEYITIKELARREGLNPDTVKHYVWRLSKKNWIQSKSVAGRGRLLTYRMRSEIQKQVELSKKTGKFEKNFLGY